MEGRGGAVGGGGSGTNERLLQVVERAGRTALVAGSASSSMEPMKAVGFLFLGLVAFLVIKSIVSMLVSLVITVVVLGVAIALISSVVSHNVNH